MGQIQKFRAVIENAGGGGAFVRMPFDVEKVFAGKRVKVKALIDGEPYRSTLVRMGGDYHILGILKEIREKIGKSFGDEVEIIVEEDLEPRVVELPPDLEAALDAEPNARTAFEKLAYTHQKEYVRWILEAKRAETRASRIQKCMALLKEGRKLQ